MTINLEASGIIYYGIITALGIFTICRVIYADKKTRGVTPNKQEGNKP